MVVVAGCRVDPAAREVRVGGELRHLEPQAFDLLAYLLAHRDRVVPKAELLDAVWGTSFVSEAALTTRVKEVRRALGDDGTRQAVVRNVRGRGYRLVAEVVDDGHAEVPDRAVLIGRDADVDAVLARLSAGCAVTVTGPGGVGKSALARAVVARVSGRLPVVHALMSEVSAPTDVLAALARAAALEVDLADPGPVVAALAAFGGVVVLDGCEHVVDAVAALADRLTAGPASVRLLATSRERLGVPAEVVWPLLPLAPAAAATLFEARARAAAPLSPLAPADRERTRRICEALDRLPLAIEMAAARTSSMQLAELEALVDERLDLLRSPHRGSPNRHRSLLAVVDWSASLLAAPERAVLAGLGVFAGPVPLEDVAAVVGPEVPGVEASAVVPALADRSLVTVTPTAGGTAYGLLQTVRAWARTQGGDDGAHQRLGARHAHHLTGVAARAGRDLRSADEFAAHARLREATAELREAFRWAQRHEPDLAARLVGSLGAYAYTRLWPEPVAWARELVSGVGPLEDSPGISVLLAADAANAGRFAEAEALAAPVAWASDDGLALEVLCDVAMYRGDLAATRRWAAALRAAGAAHDDVHLVAFGHLDEGMAWCYHGDAERAGAHLDALLALEPRLGPSDQGWCSYLRGELAAPGPAVAAYGRALAQAEQAGNRLLAGVARVSTAVALLRSGAEDEAVAAFRGAIDDARRHGNLTHGMTAVRELLPLLAARGRADTAASLDAALARLRPTFGSPATLTGGDGGWTPAEVVRVALEALDGLVAPPDPGSSDDLQAVPKRTGSTRR